jgi:hypothetical protein
MSNTPDKRDEGRGWDEIIDPETGERWIPPESIERDYGRIFTPIFTVLFILVIAACVTFVVVEERHDGHTHDSQGSVRWWKQNEGKLKAGNRTDSRLWIRDGSANFVTAVSKGKGCGRTWSIADKNGGLPGSGATTNETNCNLKWHKTCSRWSGNLDCSGRSFHPQLILLLAPALLRRRWLGPH